MWLAGPGSLFGSMDSKGVTAQTGRLCFTNKELFPQDHWAEQDSGLPPGIQIPVDAGRIEPRTIHSATRLGHIRPASRNERAAAGLRP